MMNTEGDLRLFHSYMSDIKRQIAELPNCRDCSAAEGEANALLNGDIALATRELDRLEAAGFDVRLKRADLFFELGHMAVNVLGAGPDTRDSALGDNLIGKISMAIGNKRMAQRWTNNGIGWFQQSIALDPAPPAYYNLGLLLACIGRNEEAAAAFQAAADGDDPAISIEATKAIQRLQHKSGPAKAMLFTSPAGPKSRVTAGILGLLLGGLGMHRFYLGFTPIGVIQIVVTLATLHIGGIGGLWGFVEGILILTGVMAKDADGNALI